MRILSVRKLKGLSAWSSTAALQALLGDIPEGTVCAGRIKQLDAQLDSLCVPPQLAQGVAARRTRRPCDPPVGTLVAELAGELQFLCGEFHGAREASPGEMTGTWNVVLECHEVELAEACLRAAVEHMHSLYLWNQADLSQTYRELLATVEEVCPVSSPGLVVAAARERGIPVFRMGPDQAFRLWPDEVLQLGEGIHQRRLHPWGTMTDRTGYLAGHLAGDKAFVKALWQRYGIPVPEGMVVRDEAGAQGAAARLGGPIIVKPVDADCGQGLTLRPVGAEAIDAAFALARAASSSGGVLVERCLPGAWHRLLVVDQRLVGALRRDPAAVIGDGRRTIRELVDAANRDQRRGPDARWPLRRLALEEHELEMLAAAGLTTASIPAPGSRVTLRRTATAAGGAETIDVTDLVHPETEAFALEAVRLVGLDIAGLDVIATDISRPLVEQGGGILEINEQPAIFVHAAPHCSPPRPVGEAIVESLFPGGHDGRVPMVIVIGRRQADSAVELLADLLRGDGLVVGSSTPATTRIGDRAIEPDGGSVPQRLAVLRRHPRTEVVVASASLDDILHSGLGTERCTALVLADDVADPSAEGLSGQERERLLRRLVGSARRLVIDAEQPLWEPWMELGSAEVCLVGSSGFGAGLEQHLAAGGNAALHEPGGIAIRSGGSLTRFFPIAGAGAFESNPVPHALARAAYLALPRRARPRNALAYA